MVACRSTFAHYREILQKAKRRGYSFRTFAEHAKARAAPRRLILLRHDSDFYIERERDFARIERALGIKATYFIRVHARMYNPFELASYRILREIARLGHEIGLHAEPSFARATSEPQLALLRRAKAALEAVLGEPIAGLSIHSPTNFGYGPPLPALRKLGFRYMAYEPRFTKAMKYLSDSRGSWHEGCACQWLGRADKLTILTHPFWWFAKSNNETY